MFGWQQSNGSFTEQKKLRVHLFEQQPRVRIGEYRVRFVPGQDISDLCKAIELEFEHELAARHFSATSFTVKTASGGALARDVKLSDIPLEQGDRKRRLYVEVGDPDRDRVLLNCSSCIPFIAEFEAFIALFVASAMFYVFICLDVHNGGWREHFSKGLAMACVGSFVTALATLPRLPGCLPGAGCGSVVACVCGRLARGVLQCVDWACVCIFSGLVGGGSSRASCAQ